MKVLLIQAGMPEKRRPYDVVERGQLMMPIGLAYLGAVVKEKGSEVRLKDYLAQEFNLADIIEEVRSFRPDLIGISSFTSTYNQALKIARHLKGISGASVVMGGLHVSFLPQEALKNKDIDFVIRGEGEETLRELMDFLDGKIPASSVNGLSFKDGNEVIHNEEREEIHDLDSLPCPDWSIFEKRLYESPMTGEINAPINFGRGCPYKCSFCSVGGRKRRERKAEAVIGEFKQDGERYGFKNFIVTDDVHLLNGEFRKIIEMLEKENFGIRWRMTNRIDNVDRNLLFKMKKAGCQAIGYGIESPAETTLEKTHKNISIDSGLEVIRWTREAGISVAASFIFGFPWEKKEDIENTIRFSVTLPLYSICYNLVAYFPGTEMFKQFLDKGKFTLENANWDDFTLHAATFPTDYLSRKELDGYLEKAYDYFYFRKAREDIISFVKNITNILKKRELNYKAFRGRFPAVVKAGSFYYGELLKQKGLGNRIKYMLRIIRYLLILPGL